MTIHKLKTLPKFFKEVFMDHKKFEIRINDRDFKKGDILILEEWNNKTKKYSGKKLARTVTYILYDKYAGLADGYCIMSI